MIQPLHNGEQISLLCCILPRSNKPGWVRWLNWMEFKTEFRPWLNILIFIPFYKKYQTAPASADATELLISVCIQSAEEKQRFYACY